MKGRVTVVDLFKRNRNLQFTWYGFYVRRYHMLLFPNKQMTCIGLNGVI